MSFLYKDFSFGAPRKSAPGAETPAAPPSFVTASKKRYKTDNALIVFLALIFGRLILGPFPARAYTVYNKTDLIFLGKTSQLLNRF